MSYIKIDRKLIDWKYFQRPSYVTVWMYLLCAAKYKTGNYNGLHLESGQTYQTYDEIARNTGNSYRTVRRIINVLKMDRQLDTQIVNHGMIITVLKWRTYQTDVEKSGQADGQPDGQANGQPVGQPVGQPGENPILINDLKKVKKVKKEDIHAIFEKFTSNPEMLELLDEWIENRKVRRTPNTVSAIQKNLDKLHELAVQSNMEDQEYLSEIVRLGWAAFYPIRSKDQQKTFKQLDEEREDAKYIHNIGEVLDDKPF